MAALNFLRISGTTLDYLGGGDSGVYNIRKISGGDLTDETLISTSQLVNIGDTWASFADTAGSLDDYYLYFFFNASSVVAEASSYELIEGEEGRSEIDGNIYRIEEGNEETNYYALKIKLPERYEGSAKHPSTRYTYHINIMTNDSDVHLDKNISITHNYCPIAS